MPNRNDHRERSSVKPDVPIDDYLALRSRVTREAAELFERHAPHLLCRRGCYYCCDAISVLPIEFEAMRRELEANGYPDPSLLGGPRADTGETPETLTARRRTTPTRRGPARRCAFLGRDGACTVYGSRPLICRTHGLPLAYRVYEYDANGREVRPQTPEYMDLWCDLNYRALSDDDAPAFFDANGRIRMDAINEELERLNEAFLATESGRRFRNLPPGEDRLPLANLMR
jgi:Fe-S-cluster containining protein